eukprot:CAMPEP_0178393528 /NCGR_PEP_ID=MMETSP0689_2-20121128/12234_1 /TAXON_ID=160604 /ORGANISM="Amphidinium massartii, Strain CS-259" /LENGTH=1291 /DNA_ID=CAMNT_0020014123 /DNA_START=77 /DNA_END=3949 /DNA_ORIENTATION=-
MRKSGSVTSMQPGAAATAAQLPTLYAKDRPLSAAGRSVNNARPDSASFGMLPQRDLPPAHSREKRVSWKDGSQQVMPWMPPARNRPSSQGGCRGQPQLAQPLTRNAFEETSSLMSTYQTSLQNPVPSIGRVVSAPATPSGGLHTSGKKGLTYNLPGRGGLLEGLTCSFADFGARQPEEEPADEDGLARGPVDARLYIFVQPAVPQTEKILVEVDGHATVSDMKGRVKAATGIAKNRQLMSLGPRQLLDQNLVATYGVGTRSIVTITDYSSLAADKDSTADPCWIERYEDRGITIKQLKQTLQFVRRHCQPDGVIASWYDMNSKSFSYQQPLRFDMLDIPQIGHWVINPVTSWYQCSFSEFVATDASKQQPLWYVSHELSELLERLLKCMEMHIQVRDSPADGAFWLRGFAGTRSGSKALVEEPCSLESTLNPDVVNKLTSIPPHINPDGKNFIPRRAWCGVLLVLASPDPLPRLAGGPAWSRSMMSTPSSRMSLAAHSPVASLLALSRAPSEVGTATTLSSSAGLQDDRSGALPSRLRYGCDPLSRHGCDECLAAFGGASEEADGEGETRSAAAAGLLDVAVFASSNALVVTDGPTSVDHKASSSQQGKSDATLAGSALAALTDAAWRAKERREAQFPFELILKLLPAITSIPALAKPHLRVIQFVASTLAMAVWRKCIENYVNEEVMTQLSRAVLSDTRRPSVYLGFQSVKGFDDGAAKVVAAAVRQDLDALSLNFQACNRVTSHGVSLVGEAIQATALRLLRLDFSNCPAIGNEGVEKLAAALPKALCEFRLCLKKSERIGDAGAVALARHLPQSLQVLELLLEQCGQITDVGVAALAQRLPPSLETLWLCLSLCKQVGDACLASLAQGFTRIDALSHLELEFFGCAELSDAGVAALAKTIPTALKEVRLDFRRCLELGDAAVRALLDTLYKDTQLEALNLGFQQTAASREIVQICRQLAQRPADSLSTGLEDACAKVHRIADRPDSAAVRPAQALQALGKKGRIIACAPHRPDAWVIRPTVEVDDDDLLDESWSIPDVCMLALDLTNCRQVGSRGISSLVCKMPENLRILQLGFKGCMRMGDPDLFALASGFRSTLELLELDFSSCECIGDGGVAALALGIPVTLPELRMSFWCCTEVGDPGVSALAMSLPLMLERLDLNFGLCSKVTDKGVAAFAKYFPVHTQFFQVYLNATSVSKEKRQLCANFTSLQRWRPSEKEVAEPAQPWHPPPTCWNGSSGGDFADAEHMVMRDEEVEHVAEDDITPKIQMELVWAEESKATLTEATSIAA